MQYQIGKQIVFIELRHIVIVSTFAWRFPPAAPASIAVVNVFLTGFNQRYLVPLTYKFTGQIAGVILIFVIRKRTVDYGYVHGF